MTGLDIEKDHILEIACLITDNSLKIISDELCIVIHQSDKILDSMNEWSRKHHKIVRFCHKNNNFYKFIFSEPFL